METISLGKRIAVKRPRISLIDQTPLDRIAVADDFKTNIWLLEVGITLGVGLVALLYSDGLFTLFTDFPYSPSATGIGWFLACTVPLALATILIALKQRQYYSGTLEPGSKRGIFRYLLGQATDLERTLDASNAFLGGLMVPFALGLPVLWFWFFAAFSGTVIGRTLVTLRRPATARHYQEKIHSDPVLSTAWLVTITRGVYQGVRVRNILSGWVVTHVVWAAFAALAGLLFVLRPFAILWMVAGLWLLIAALLVGEFSLSRISVGIGERLCRVAGWRRLFALEDG